MFSRKQEPLQQDFPCPHCGYNLRGLPKGRRCPECGATLDENLFPSSVTLARRPLIDILATGGVEQRARWKLALLIAAIALVAVLGGRWFMFISTDDAAIAKGYLTLGSLLSVAWLYAVWLMMLPPLVTNWPWMKPWRGGVLATQAMWPIAYAFWWWAAMGNGPGFASTMNYLLRAIAAIGFIVFMQLVRFIAEEAQLDNAARRLNAGSWFVAIPAVILWALGGTVSQVEMVAIGLVLLLWTWPMTLLVLGVLEMRGHVKWAERHEHEQVGREERIAEKRKQYEAQNAGKVRPVRLDRKKEEAISVGDLPVPQGREPDAEAPDEGDIPLGP